MIVTEEEAKTKRCQESFGPVSAATVTVGPGVSPFGHSINQPMFPMFPVMPINCIGPACMAWRWHFAHLNGDTFNPVVQTEFGYCGKAGKP